MARPLPVNLLLAGTGAVLLVSGIGGESIGEVLKGSFGDVTGKQQAAADIESGGAVTSNVADSESGAPAASPSTFSSATFAPSPTHFSKKDPTPKQQAAGIARILLSEGITHPTNHQIELARARYERETGVTEFEGGQSPQGFVHGLPLI